MKLIIGLGNPGKEYVNTRHNVGFMMVEEWSGEVDGEWKNEKKFMADVKVDGVGEERIFYVKPQTFMNESGKAVAAIVNMYKIDVRDICVVYDDLDIRFGQWKIMTASGPKVHNGLNSVIEALGTNEFSHVRVGIDNRNLEMRLEGAEYVLQRFSDQELLQLPKLSNQINQHLQVAFL